MSCAAGSEDVQRNQAATLLRRAIVGPGETPWEKASTATHIHVQRALFQCLEQEPLPQVRKIIVAGIAVAARNATAEAPWPDLVPNAFTLAASGHINHQAASLLLLGQLVNTTRSQEVFARQQDLAGLMRAGLTTPTLQASALSLVADMVGALGVSGRKALQDVLPLAEEALRSIAATDRSAFEEVLQVMIDCAEEQAGFFTPRYAAWVEMMLAFAHARGTLDDGVRNLAFQWIVAVATHKPKVLLKAVPDLPAKTLSLAFAFMLEVTHDDEWEAHDEDAEDDEEDDAGLRQSGEARVDFFVSKLGFAATKDALGSLIKQHATGAAWEGRVAAAMAIRASIEYVDVDAAVDDMLSLLLQLLKDEHMRVRYAAAFAIGQMCHDKDEAFHQRWHSRLMHPLIQSCGDPVHRVAAMAIGAVEAHVSELDESILLDYAPSIMEMGGKLLQACSHRGVLVSVMEVLGALAAGLAGSFDGFYDQLMPVLMASVSRPDVAVTDGKLRGKAFECISLFGYAVGKERFAPAARQSMTAMLATPASADEFQTACLRDSMERMCKVLGADFAPFLPSLLPGILGTLSMDALVIPGSDASGEGDVDEEAEDEITIPTETGFAKVRTSQITEVLSVVSMLCVFIKETGVSFFDYIKPTVQALSRILGCADSVLKLASNVRDAVYPCWAELVEAASKAIPSRGKEAQDIVVELVQTFVEKVGSDLARSEEPEDLAPMAHGVASVVANAGSGCLQPAQVQACVDLAIAEITKSFQRDKVLSDTNKALQMQSQQEHGAPAAVEADADDDEEEVGSAMFNFEDDVDDDEKQGRLGLMAICGACMKVAPDIVLAHAWPQLEALLKGCLVQTEGGARLLGLHFVCDLLEHLGERATSIWPVFLDTVFTALTSEDAEERHYAAFAVLLAAPQAAFGQCVARAGGCLVQALKQFKGKRSDEEAQYAADNCTAALAQLCLSHPAACPDLDNYWDLVFARLPLKADLVESKRLHRKLFIEVLMPQGGALGGPARQAQVFGYFCDIYGRSEHCDDDMRADIGKAFAALPQVALESLLPHLSAK
eukprot:CAMPEP_0178407226 /NCGR_PEP_ID=MMETSP0689_2-20121128/19318_1 /TAXON_ID=160604 /ORGANISM="Amphidinium massartii, Strain CS-259" /LENGTH=1058 /DNA_ID=CAMNT_0020028291 /DNA_START=291 /DNA_END=3464 /DNA_ORIENTATION=-